MSDDTTLRPALIGQHFREGYERAAPTLNEWEKAKAALLVQVGQECLVLIRTTLEPMADHDLTGRKAARCSLVKSIEEALPSETEGIGAPQVNRWIRWAGACELLKQESDAASLGLRQSHLMVLERIVEQNEARAEFRLKGPWQTRLAEIQGAVRSAIASSSAASELETALDKLAVLAPSAPPQPAPKAQAPVAPAPEPTGAQPAKREAPTPPKPAPAPSPATKATNKASPATPSPGPVAAATPRPAPAAAPPSPADLADQAFKLLQQPEILAGVFRREWKPELLKEIVENLIRANGEQIDNAHGLAVAYHRMKPFVLTFFEEYAADGKFKLRRKEEPKSPTLEQLVPAAQLATA